MPTLHFSGHSTGCTCGVWRDRTMASGGLVAHLQRLTPEDIAVLARMMDELGLRTMPGAKPSAC